jgi:hypothetical protein
VPAIPWPFAISKLKTNFTSVRSEKDFNAAVFFREADEEAFNLSLDFLSNDTETFP